MQIAGKPRRVLGDLGVHFLVLRADVHAQTRPPPLGYTI
jgi:hypothetical protein